MSALLFHDLEKIQKNANNNANSTKLEESESEGNVKHKSLEFSKMISLLMRCGKRGKAAALFYSVFSILQKKLIEFKRKSIEYCKYVIQQKKQIIFDYCGDGRSMFLGFPFSFSLLLIMELFYFIKTVVTTNMEKWSSVKSESVGQDEGEELTGFSFIRKAVANVVPFLEVRKVRRKGTTRQVPSTIKENRQQSLALRWLVEGAKSRKKKSKNSFSQCLSAEIVDAYKKQGSARQKRNELHKLAQSNRTFLRYRWW